MWRKIIALESIAFSPNCLPMRVGAWHTYLKKCSSAALRLAPQSTFSILTFWMTPVKCKAISIICPVDILGIYQLGGGD